MAAIEESGGAIRRFSRSPCPCPCSRIVVMRTDVFPAVLERCCCALCWRSLIPAAHTHEAAPIVVALGEQP